MFFSELCKSPTKISEGSALSPIKNRTIILSATEHGTSMFDFQRFYETNEWLPDCNNI